MDSQTLKQTSVDKLSSMTPLLLLNWKKVQWSSTTKFLPAPLFSIKAVSGHFNQFSSRSDAGEGRELCSVPAAHSPHTQPDTAVMRLIIRDVFIQWPVNWLPPVSQKRLNLKLHVTNYNLSWISSSENIHSKKSMLLGQMTAADMNALQIYA